MQGKLKTITPIIKISGDYCNSKCRYCFYFMKNQIISTIMDFDLLEKFIYQYLNLFDGKIRFIWHGGEPLLAGLSFFEKIVRLQKKFQKNGQIIRNSVQTNATLLDDSWIEFFKVNNFHVGISLDGPEEIHNNFRNNFDLVIKAVKTLQEREINYGIIQTVPGDNIDYAKKIFDFFVKDTGIKSWGVNIFNDIRRENKAMLSQNVTNSQYLKFFKDYIDFWLQENSPSIKIREVENFMAGVIGKRAASCSFNGTCTRFFCLNYNGEVYPCDRLCGYSEYLLGDLSKQSLVEILNSHQAEEYAKKVNFINKDCANCKWYKVCHNGCASQRVGGVSGKYYFCDARKEIFEYLTDKVREFRLERG